MNIKNIFALIILCIIMPHTYTMERELVPLLETEITNYSIDNNCHLFKLPNECIDTIIFSNNPEEIGALKNTCKRLASLASIVRADNFPIHHFTIHDYATRLALFKTIVKTDNNEYIEKILEYGKNKAHLHHKVPEDATVIILDKSRIEKEYLNKRYLPYLLRYAIEENKYNSVYTLTKNGAETIHNYAKTPLEYAAQYDSDHAIQALFECNTIDKGLIEDALDIAWNKKNHKALQALNKNENTEKFITTLKKERCSYIAKWVWGGIMTLGVLTGTVSDITFWIINDPCYKNITRHCID